MANMAHPNAPKMQDNKARQALGPRLKTYLSSSNLLNLVHPAETISPSKEGVEEWPDVEPIFDETTTTANSKLDKWVAAIRYRLWKYDDIPLSVAYNNPLLWMTDECIKVSKENNRLRDEILQLEHQNRILLQKNSQQSKQVHRASHSHSGIPSWIDSLIKVSKMQRELESQDEYVPMSKLYLDSRSTSISPARFPASATHVISKEKERESLHGHTEEPSTLPNSRNLESPISFSSSDHSDVPHGLLPDEEEEFKSRQDAAVQLSTYVARHTRSDIRSHYPEIARILRVPTSIPQTILHTPEQIVVTNNSSRYASTGENETHVQELIPRIQRSASFSQSRQRIFSFYPGDDNIQESSSGYTIQQQSSDYVQQPSPERSISEPQYKIPDVRCTIQPNQDSTLAREDSQDSTVTVMRLPRTKVSGSRTSSQNNTVSHGKNAVRAASQDSKQAIKPQGPLAAAIAATAKFGKTGKKTIRQVQ